MNRRELLMKSLQGIALTAGAGLAHNAVASVCQKTVRQPEGPFYPVSRIEDENTDLTVVGNSLHHADGEVIIVQGRVIDQNCNPVTGALVEIWQANKHGRYNHPNDPNTGVPFDPHFQYWGRAYSDQSGFYNFKTIKPGAYPAGDGWIRPPHIHFKITKLGYIELITQLYFSGDPLNDTDLILQRVPAHEQKTVITQLQKQPDGIQVGEFNITLTKLRT